MEKVWVRSYGEGVSRNLDYEAITMSDVLKRSTSSFPKAKSLEFAGNRISFKAFDEQVNQVANGLIAMGVAKGDRVALLLPNIPQVAVATYATWRIGGVVVMNNPLYTDAELEHQLKDSGATVLIALDLLVPRMLKLRPKTGIKTVIVAHIRDYLPFPKKQLFPFVAKDKHRNIPPEINVIEWSTMLKTYSKRAPSMEVGIDDTAALQYTGGTTGVSKGVVLTHGNLSKNCQQGLAWLPMLKPLEKVVLGSLPIFHAFGLFTLNMCVFGGWEMVMLPRPTAEEIMKAIARNRVNLFPGVPTMFVDILNHPKVRQYDMSSLDFCVSGAAPCPVDVLERFEKLTGAQILEGYGISEASPATAINPVNGKNKPGTIGLPFPDTVVKITALDDPDKEMPLGEAGELAVKGPQVAREYYNMAEETRKTFRNGWLYTGDIATMDKDGYISIVDRLKDMIIASGYNIYPREIDEVLFAHPKVVEACAKGVPDPKRGETVKAFVVPCQGVTLTEEELDEYCREHLAAYKVPTLFEFMEELPKSAVGKILRKDL
ncbi:MAG: long-chain fatty acid--CoA ligase [Desulfobacteraceae bacterium]|nr:long-chain fatty acid--CoA ligase [Desulfobacteraceae bacterium]